MKMQNILVKILPLVLVFSLLGPLIPNTVANAANNSQIDQKRLSYGNVAFEDNTFKVTESNNVRTVLNKITLQKAALTFTNPQHTDGIYKDINGNEHKYSTSTNGNIYLDGKIIVEATATPVSSSTLPLTQSLVASPSFYNSDHFSHNGRTYYYVITYKYSTSLQKSITTIESDMLSFLPYAGYVIALYTLIQDMKNTGASNMYVVEKEYCTSNYQYYAFKYYFNKYSNYTGCVKSTVVYKTMW